MKIIGIVGRAYENKDGEKIFQINEAVRLALANYNDITAILLLPTNNSLYPDLEMGTDEITDLDKQKLDYVLNFCDGLIVPGGSNWHKFDEYVIDYAIKKDIPLLAICAGFQALCCMDATSKNKFDMTKKLLDDTHYENKTTYKHTINILENTILEDIIKEKKIPVNSLHHDYIDFNFKNLKTCAISEDGLIEGVYLPNKKFILGLQWHPEYLMDVYSQKIFNYFIAKIKDA